jgi:hypothetical protein
MYNWGIRKGFGPVLLDFPYIYELDGAKLFCQSRLMDGSICGGEIDYDAGFNFLTCSKCGELYRANELSKPAGQRTISISEIRTKGVIKMEVAYMRGNDTIKTNHSKDTSTFMKRPREIKYEKKKITDPSCIKKLPDVMPTRGNKKMKEIREEYREKQKTVSETSTRKINELPVATVYRESDPIKENPLKATAPVKTENDGNTLIATGERRIDRDDRPIHSSRNVSIPKSANIPVAQGYRPNTETNLDDQIELGNSTITKDEPLDKIPGGENASSGYMVTTEIIPGEVKTDVSDIEKSLDAANDHIDNMEVNFISRAPLSKVHVNDDNEEGDKNELGDPENNMQMEAAELSESVISTGVDSSADVKEEEKYSQLELNLEGSDVTILPPYERVPHPSRIKEKRSRRFDPRYYDVKGDE